MKRDIRYLQERSVNINRITDRLVETFNRFADEYLKTSGKIDPIYYKKEGKIVEYVYYEEDGIPEEVIVLALDNNGLWILAAMHEEIEENQFPTLTKGNQLKFSELPTRLKYQIIGDLPHILESFSVEMKSVEDEAQEMLSKLETIVHSLDPPHNDSDE
ncbi:MAG: hypothetical protein ACFFDT_15240 [Candidatus Hodarchaeota archaeon]